MAATGNTVTLQSRAYQGRYMKLTCTSTQDIANNKTNISWTLESIGGSSGHYATICRVYFSWYVNGTKNETCVYSIDKGYTYNAFPVTKGSTNGSISVPMDSDGNKTIYVDMDVAIYTSTTQRYSVLDGWQLPTVPRYPTISSFSVNKISKSSTSLSFVWSASAPGGNISKLEYSTDNGASFKTASSVTSPLTVSGLASNTGYNCKIIVTSSASGLTATSGTVWQATYQQPSANIWTENISGYNGLSQIKVNWSSNMTIYKVEYSKDNGATWEGAQYPNATSGNDTFIWLNEGQTYNFKVRVEASDGHCVTVSGTSSRATYSRVRGNLYVNNVKVATNNGQTGVALKNGDTLEIKDIVNGANCSYKLFFENPDNQNGWTSATATGTTAVSMTAEQIRQRLQYMSATNSQGFNVGIVTLNGSGQHALYYEFFGTISVVNSNPIFTTSNWTYQDTNATTVALTGSDQILVNGFSKLRVNVGTAATPQNYATITQYIVSGCTSGSSTTTGNIDCATPTNGGTIKVTAKDSRGNPTETSRTATYKNYVVPTLENISATRNNGGVGTVTTLTFNGTWWNDNFGASNNTLTAVYRYKSGSTWSAPRAITLTIDQEDPSKYSFSDKIYGDLAADGFTLGTTFTIEVTITDELNGGKTWTTVLNSGTPAIAISGSKVAIGKQYDTNKGGDLQVLGSVFLGNNDGTGSFQIHGQSGSNIYWKEYNYGDQFRIIPEFGGTDDSNKLRIQGAVGDVGTTPTLYDLATVSGKNGNLWLKGGITVNGTISRSFSETTLSPTNIIDVAGGTDGFQIEYQVPSSDQGVTTIKTTDDNNAKIQIGNQVSSSYKNAITVQDGIASVTTRLQIPNNGGAGFGLTNAGGISIIRDHSNKNVTVDATGDTLFLGYQNTKGINILNGKDSISSDGTFNFPRGIGIDFGSGTIKGNSQYNDLSINNSGGWTYLTNNGTTILTVRGEGLYSKNGYPYYCGKDLYNNSSGTSGTITLSETAANFTFVEIFYRKGDGGGTHSVKVDTGKNMSSISIIAGIPISTTAAQIHVDTLAISGTSLTHSANYGINLYTNPRIEIFTANEMRVTRVVGWRTT